MRNGDLKILFMGTPDFAAASLEALIGNGYNVASVFTKPDGTRGRGMKRYPSPVKEIAQCNRIPCFQPETLKDGECFKQAASLEPDLIVVVAYGLFLPRNYLELPKLACINVHGSLLPKYRGAAPIQWAIIKGETHTGVCTMHMERSMDSGNVILSKSVEISDNETYGTLYDRLKLLGTQVLLDTIPLLTAGNAPSTPQDPSQVSYAPPITREDARIDWTLPARDIHNLIRGTQPVPCARSGEMRIHESKLTERSCDEKPGTVVMSDKQGFHVCCGDGRILCITAVQPPGGVRMSAAAYAMGHGAPEIMSGIT